MKPLIKYPGGKEHEIKYVVERLPEYTDYYEPFLGGGAVFFGLDTENKSYLNDKSEDLVNLYDNVKHQKPLFFTYLNAHIKEWACLTKTIDDNREKITSNREGDEALVSMLTNKLSDTYKEKSATALRDKLKRMQKLEAEKGSLSDNDKVDNVECGIKQGYYYYIRDIYNNKIKDAVVDEERAAVFYFIREYCYSSMFRFNASGEFNVPYGGISYNRKDFASKVNRLKDKEVVEKLKNACIECLDFEEFFKKHPPTKQDFIFLDPPYDSKFSDYDNNCFNADDQRRLANCLINEYEGKWLMIIKATELIINLYKPGAKTKVENLNIEGFDKKYLVSFKNRNLKDCEHLIIRNF